MKNTKAYTDLDELDNNVRRARLESGMTPKELAAALRIKRENLYAIELGYVSAIGRDGSVKPIVFKLSENLGWSIAELFPREICSIENTLAIDILFEQQDGISRSESIENSFETKRLIKLMVSILKTERHKEVIYRIYWLDETYTEIATVMRVTRAWVSQLHIKLLNVMRYWAMRNEIYEHFEVGNFESLRKAAEARRTKRTERLLKAKTAILREAEEQKRIANEKRTAKKLETVRRREESKARAQAYLESEERKKALRQERLAKAKAKSAEITEAEIAETVAENQTQPPREMEAVSILQTLTAFLKHSFFRSAV